MDINKQQHTHHTNNNNQAQAPLITADASILFSADFPNAKEMDDEIGNLLSKDSRKAIELLLPLVKKYPDEPILAYHLANAYESSGDHDFCKQVEEDNYRKFPYFSLIRCSYVVKCLKEDNIMQAAAALNYTFSLSDLYPKRPAFHILEIIMFQSTLTRYFCKIKDFDRAAFAIAELRAVHKKIPVIKDLQNVVVLSIVEQNLSATGFNYLFDFEKEDGDSDGHEDKDENKE